MNGYEQAVEELEQARRSHDRAKARFMEAETELAAAELNLAGHESSPGIPLPQYREQVSAA